MLGLLFSANHYRLLVDSRPDGARSVRGTMARRSN